MSNQSFASAVRAASLTGADNQMVPGNRGARFVLDVTVAPGVDTVTLIIENKDVVSGKYIQVAAAAARVITGTDVITVMPGIATSGTQVSDALSDVYRARVAHSAASNFTYSLSVVER